MNIPKIVLLAGKGDSTNILFNGLNKTNPFVCIIQEDPVNRMEFLKRRIKKLGIGKVIGQILFQLFIVKFLDLTSGKRKKQIMGDFQLNSNEIPRQILFPVKSVNDDRCIKKLQDINPALVIVSGTRIISKQVLNCISARFINIHAGITPLYRGVHGAYWALVNNDQVHCGVTAHFVDAGIDTGGVICQQPIPVSPSDNFVTYPIIQLGVGINLMKKAITRVLDKDFDTIEVKGDSRLWYHPGIFQYLYFRLSRMVK